MSVWKKAGYQAESKALEKSMVARISESPAWVCSIHPKGTEKGTEFDLE